MSHFGLISALLSFLWFYNDAIPAKFVLAKLDFYESAEQLTKLQKCELKSSISYLDSAVLWGKTRNTKVLLP